MTASAKFTPLRDYILVRPVDRLKNLSSVIEVVSDEKDTRGEVVAVGPGNLNGVGQIVPLDVEIGDRVCFGNGTYLSFPKVEIAGEQFAVMREADICWIEPRGA